MASADTASTLFGRDAELRRVRHFVAAPGPRSMVLEGPAGIGKSSLWEAGIEAARQHRRALVTRARAGEAEWSYSGLGDLVGSSLGRAANDIPGPQARVLRIALLQAPTTQEPVDARLVAAAVLSLLRVLASERPLLIAVDDLQWLDRATAQALASAAWRLTDDDVRILATERVDDTGADRRAIVLPGERNERLLLGSLDEIAIGRLARERLGRGVPRSQVKALAALSGGNPFFAGELLRSSAHEDGRPADSRGVSQDLAALLRQRLEALPVDAQAALPLVAALARPTLRLLAELIDLEVLDAAFSSKVLRLDGDQVRFHHPLIAAAALEGLAPGRRMRLHDRLAEVAPTREERARHLALATLRPSLEIARELEGAAIDVVHRGAPAAAVELLEHALRLTPGDDHAGYAARASALLSSLRAADDLALAARRGRELIGALPPGPSRASVRAALADTETLPLPEAVEMARAALDEAGADADVALRARLLLVLANAHINANDFRAALGYARDALSFAEDADDHVLRVHALALTGELEIHALDGRGWRRLRAAMELEGHDRLPDTYISPAGRLGSCLLWADKLEEARPLLERQYVLSEQLGDEYNRVGFCELLAELECRAGRVEPARRYATEALLAGEQSGSDRALATGWLVQVMVDAISGEADDAHERGRRALAVADEIGDELCQLQVRGSLGHCELSRGNHREALGYLDGLQGRLEAIGMSEPGCIPIHADAIEARVRAGDPREAGAGIEAWEALGRRLDRPSIIAGAARARGLLAGRQGRHQEAVAELERARELTTRLPLPLERARTLLALGVAYRRTKQRRRAREALEEALRIFDAIPARLWADQARAELSRVGGRTSSRDELTSTEARVAQLVAAGHTNREVAAALYVTVATVEATLTRVYRKLGVRSRTQLARAYAAQAPRG